MTSPALAAYTFLPWVQGGVGSSIVAADEPATTLPARVPSSARTRTGRSSSR